MTRSQQVTTKLYQPNRLQRFLSEPLLSIVDGLFQLTRLHLADRAVRLFSRAYPEAEVDADARYWLKAPCYINHVRVELSTTSLALLLFVTDAMSHPIHFLLGHLRLGVYCPTCESDLAGGWARPRDLRANVDELLRRARSSGHRCHS
jgi:hypothetical protein